MTLLKEILFIWFPFFEVRFVGFGFLVPVQEMVRKAATDRGEIVRPAQAGCFSEAITLRGDLVTC